MKSTGLAHRCAVTVVSSTVTVKLFYRQTFTLDKRLSQAKQGAVLGAIHDAGLCAVLTEAVGDAITGVVK